MRIATFYFVLFAAVGVMLPYLPPYLRSLGFSGVQIAATLAVTPALTVFVPPLWGFLADRTRRPTALLRFVTAAWAITYVPLLWLKSFPAILAILALAAIFATPVSGLTDAIAVGEARRTGASYGRLRLWGSVGFVVASTLFGLHLEAGGAASDAIPATLLALFAGALAAHLVPERTGAALSPPSLAEAGQLLSDPSLLLFFLAGLVHWAAMAPFHLFYAVHLESLGAGPRWIAAGLLLAVGTEVGLMGGFGALQRRFRLFPLLGFSFLTGVLRFTVTALVPSGPVVAAAQLLHGAGFGLFFLASLAHLERTVPEHLRATGRALYGALVFGAGGVIGNAVAGPLFDQGGAPLAFGASVALELVAPVILLASGALGARRVLAALRPAPAPAPARVGA